MKPEQHHLTLIANWHQFYIGDEDYRADTAQLWDAATTDRMLAVGPDLIAVVTARDMDVPVTLEMHQTEPGDDADEWEQIIDCGAVFASGRIMAFGCGEYEGDAQRFTLQPGSYKARVSFKNLTAISDDGFNGDDQYRVQLWPGNCQEVTVIKRRP